MKRKFIGLVISLVLVCTSATFGVEEKVNAANYLNQVGILKGSSGDFGLEKEITRIEGLVLIYKYLGLEETALELQNELSVFEDVPAWAVGYTNLAVQDNVTTGTGEGKFSPNLNMSRNQFLLTMLRAVGDVDVESVTLSDASQVAYNKGLVDAKLLDASSANKFYKGDAVNIISRLVYTQRNESSESLEYWVKHQGIDQTQQAAFEKDIATIFNRVKAKYSLNYNMVGLCVEELNSGYRYSYGDELVYDKSTGLTKGKFASASAVKFPMAMAVLTQMESKGIQLNDSFKDGLSGKTLRFDQVLQPMITQSTNNSFNYLLRYLGRDKANAFMSSIGAKNSVINGELGGGDAYWSIERLKKVYGTTIVSRFTPSDYGILLSYFYDKVQMKNPYMLYLNQIMIDNIHSSRIPKGINYKYKVAHKTGTYSDKGRYVDVGIVYHPKNPYALAILLDAQTNHASCEPFMRELTAAINNYFEQR